ncbi:hypothetical protein [Jiella avicenniae]|uniref:Uncharacterized protein n=1 Tax=Jiella avicenniae TaxID=2907202 RepID=A0A9X1T3F8_9HYPH|nr:hypothetical protein [Jiella avicenniae]MCE7026409.1 hypothetical protein [Jiella avicenniae]
MIRRRAPHDRDRLAYLVAAGIAAELCRVEVDDVIARGTPGTFRRRRVRTARALALYLAHTGANLSIARVSRASGRTKQRVSFLCHLIEDRRDEPAFEVLVSRAEGWFLLRFGAAPIAMVAAIAGASRDAALARSAAVYLAERAA